MSKRTKTIKTHVGVNKLGAVVSNKFINNIKETTTGCPEQVSKWIPADKYQLKSKK